MVDHQQEEILEILGRVKELARRYYTITGKPLGVAGEIAEYEAHRLLGVELAPARTPGYDAIERREGKTIRLQIKGRCLQPDKDRSPRLGKINTEHEWDRLLMVLMDPSFDTTSIHEASRADVQVDLDRKGSVARNLRRSLSVSKVKSIATIRWPRAG